MYNITKKQNKKILNTALLVQHIIQCAYLLPSAKSEYTIRHQRDLISYQTNSLSHNVSYHIWLN